MTEMNPVNFAIKSWEINIVANKTLALGNSTVKASPGGLLSCGWPVRVQ